MGKQDFAIVNTQAILYLWSFFHHTLSNTSKLVRTYAGLSLRGEKKALAQKDAWEDLTP